MLIIFALKVYGESIQWVGREEEVSLLKYQKLFYSAQVLYENWQNTVRFTSYVVSLYKVGTNRFKNR